MDTFENASWQLLFALKDLLVPALAVAVTGLLRYGIPVLKARVPGFVWPFLALWIDRQMIAFCYWLNVPCEGHFTNWEDPQAYAFAQGLAVIGIHRLTKTVKNVTPATTAKVQALGARLGQQLARKEG